MNPYQNPYQQQPVMYPQQQPQGPQQPLQWQNIGADQQQQQGMGMAADGGGGLQALLARFKRPQGSPAVDSPMPDFGGGGMGSALA